MTKQPEPNSASEMDQAEGERNHVSPEASKATEEAVDEARPRDRMQKRPDEPTSPGSE